jgi:hypothetical protein
MSWGVQIGPELESAPLCLVDLGPDLADAADHA